jgi:hypothetical protein
MILKKYFDKIRIFTTKSTLKKNILKDPNMANIPTSKAHAESLDLCSLGGVELLEALLLPLLLDGEVLVAVFQIHDILVWIRIRGSMPLTNGSGCGSGSFYFHH